MSESGSSEGLLPLASSGTSGVEYRGEGLVCRGSSNLGDIENHSGIDGSEGTENPEDAKTSEESEDSLDNEETLL